MSIAVAMLALSGAAAAYAEKPVYVTSAAVENKPVVSPDPSKGYALLRSFKPVSLYVIRVPDADDRKIYEEARAAALAEERAKFPDRMKSYERNMAAYERTKGTDPAVKMPEKPLEPTADNFEYPAYELLAQVNLGGSNRFAKGEKGASVYLRELKPGRYRIYGSGQMSASQAVCFCMGSVAFDVKAGEVADLGMLVAPDGLMPVTDAMPTDARLAQWTVRPAHYRAVGKLPNYFGVNVSRIQPIPSVIAYDRDRIVDLAPQSPAP